MQLRTRHLRCENRTIAFVPTMGFLHEGHLSLMRTGREQADILVASIFVNPAQFAPHEDFEAYPRDMARDLALAETVGTDIVFTPNDEMMFQAFCLSFGVANLKRMSHWLKHLPPHILCQFPVTRRRNPNWRVPVLAAVVEVAC